MPVQTGAQSLTSGVTIAVVTFPTPYVSAPETVLAAVQNLSADVTKLQIDVLVTEITNVGFTVALSVAPDSVNYELSWWAGGPGELTVLLNYVHQRIDRQPRKSVMAANDRLIGVDMAGGIPRTVLMRMSDLDVRWVNRQTNPPSAANSPGTPGDIAGDSSYLYFRLASGWVRVPLINDAVWATSYAAKPTRKGVVNLNNTDVIQTVSFDVPFSGGAAPSITCQVQNLSVASEKLLISAMPVESSLATFKIALSAVPDTSDYQLIYEAVQN